MKYSDLCLKSFCQSGVWRHQVTPKVISLEENSHVSYATFLEKPYLVVCSSISQKTINLYCLLFKNTRLLVHFIDLKIEQIYFQRILVC